jgi:hypothetical protein
MTTYQMMSDVYLHGRDPPIRGEIKGRWINRENVTTQLGRPTVEASLTSADDFFIFAYDSLTPSLDTLTVMSARRNNLRLLHPC